MALRVECEEYFKQVCDFAAKAEASEALTKALNRLRAMAGDGIAHLHSDFAPHSFAFVIFDEAGKRGLMGGMIYSGPNQILNGSAPTFTVSIEPPSNEHKWSIHT